MAWKLDVSLRRYTVMMKPMPRIRESRLAE